jgi:hypothetical protein
MGEIRVRSMVTRRSTRRWLCSWLGALLLFMQLAAAAYACPKGSVGADDDAAIIAAMVDCESHRVGDEPASQPLLCKAHCQQGTDTVQSSPTQGVGDAPAPLALVAVLDWRALAQLQSPRLAGTSFIDAGAAPPGSPPRYLSLQVLRN